MRNKVKKYTVIGSTLLMLASCGPSLETLRQATPHQRAEMVCVYSVNWNDAKNRYEKARKQRNLWQTDANNGYEVKKQCNTVQEPYTVDERRCTTGDLGRVCYDETVTKYRTSRKCHNVYVPINIEYAQQRADAWADRRGKAEVDMQNAWRECYSWATRATPEALHNWLP